MIVLTCELLVHAASGFLVMARPHLSEVCFFMVGLCRLAVGLCLGSKVMPMTSALQWWMDNHMEKLFELLFSGQMRLSIQVPLRVCLVYGYATTYTRLQKPYPWITAILMQMAAAAFQLIMSTTNPWQLLGSTKSKQAPAAAAAVATAAAAAATTAPIATKKLLGCAGGAASRGSRGGAWGVGLAGSMQPPGCASSLPLAPAKEEPGDGSEKRSGLVASKPGDVVSPKGQSNTLLQQVLQAPPPAVPPPAPLHVGSQTAALKSDLGRRARPAAGAAASKQAAAAAAVAARQQHARRADPETLQQLRRIQSSLQGRQKYITHFRHHLVSFKVPCQSEPSSLKPDALSDFRSCVHASMTDVEVLSAAMRAGCIILCADIMVQGSLRRQQQQQQQCSSALVTGAAGGVGSGDGVQQQWGSDEVELGLALAAAAQQWLQNTRLAEELPPTATLLLQVNSSYFLCRQRAPAATQHDTSATATSNQHHQQQLAWEVQGPQPLSLLPHMQPLLPSCTIRTTSPSVLLPPSSPTFGSSSSSSSGCAPTAAPLPLPACASNTAASVAEGDGVMLQGSTHQHASHHSGGGAGAATGDLRLGAPAALVVRIRVQVPQCAEVLGWQEGEGGGAPRVFSSAVGSTGTDGASPAGNPRTPQLKVLACVGSRYLPTRVVCHPALPAAAEPAVGSPAAAESAAAKPAAAAPEPEARIGHLGAPTAGSGMETREFDLVIPVPEVHAALGPHDAHALPAGLRLELWHHELLLDFSLVLLVPSNLPGAHAELHRLPWGLPGADSDVSDFVVDLGAWMQRAGSDELQQSLHHSNPRTDQQAPVPAATPAATPAADRQAPSEIEAAPEAPRAGSSAGTPCAAPAAAPIAGTPDEPAAAPFVGMPGAAPAVAPAPAPVPLDAVALCGPGVQLLRQAVLWGMPCLSTLLVEKLLATLSWTHLVSAASAAPGTPSAVTPPPDPRNQQGAGQEMEGGEEEMEEEMEVVHVDDLGGLLHMSLLSPCPQQMLRAVIGWGKKWGQTSNTISTGDSSSGSGRQGAGAGSGFRWQWDEPNPLGLTPCQLLGSHTDKEALLQVVLEEDPAAWLSAQRALDAAARQERNLAGEKGTCDGGERRAGAQGDARNGFWSVSEGVRWRTLGQLGSFISSATKGVLRQRCNRELHMQGQQHGQTEDGALAAVADLAPPGVAPPAPATTEPPTPSAMIPHKRALWKAALRSTLFGLGDGTHWGGGLVGPSEQSYMQWAEVYTHNMLAMRFNFLLLGCVVGVVRSLANGLLCQSEVLLQYSITSAYFWGILKRRRKAGMRYARYGHIAMWAFLGLGILPMENNTISMVATYSESLVLFVLFSPVLEQSSLRALLLERLSTTWVFFLLFRTLGVWAPLHRAVVQNALSAAAELVFIGAHLRYTFLKSWADSQQQQAVQAKKGT